MLHILRKLQRPIALFILFTLGLTFIPNTRSYALTSGPSQPETQQFAPAGMDNMVDPFTGDFSYNIPLMDVGGYPINLNYAGGVTQDEEASWVGLGWNVNVGAINRTMRGLPDDMKGEDVTKTYNVKPNQTFSVDVAWKDEIYGVNFSKIVKASKNVTLTYNTYNGMGVAFGISPRQSLGKYELGPLTGSLGNTFTIGSEEGLGFTPRLSLSHQSKNAKTESGYGATLSFPYNTRDGIKGLSLSASYPASERAVVKQGSRAGNANAFFGFATPSYTPDIPHNSYNVNLDLGLSWSVTANLATEFKSYDITGYYSGQFLKNTTVNKPGYGYLYAGTDNSDNVLLDFNREKDSNVDKNTKNLPLTNVTHDVFSATGQGVSGAYRLFRTDVAAVNDPAGQEIGVSPTLSADLDLGAPNVFKLGIDFKFNASSSTTGKWDDGAIPEYKSPVAENTVIEPVYFKKMGEMTGESDPAYFASTSNTDLVQPKLADITGSLREMVEAPGTPNKYLLKNNTNTQQRSTRIARNENLSYLTAKEADASAVRPKIYSYPLNDFYWGSNTQVQLERTAANVIKRLNTTYTPDNTKDLKRYDDGIRKEHHISEVRLTQPGGSRYVYGIPVYNTHYHESTFSTGEGDVYSGLVSYNSQDNSTGNKQGLDHMFSKSETPAYAYSYLLTEVLSADYVDSDGIPGPSDGDLGNYTKFNYSKLDNVYKWRTPIASAPNMASYNKGQISDPSDDKGSIVYGEKEIWYTHSIETRTHLAEFYTEPRKDAFGVTSEDGAVGGTQQMLLRKIVLYAKADKKGGSPTPIKTVHFDYTYELCPGSPNSQALAEAGKQRAGGKLTLKKVWFTYGDSKKGVLNPYVFNYPAYDDVILNPDYSPKGYDRWGNYKEQLANKPNAEFPYTPQDKQLADQYANVYKLQSITTPTGGKIEVSYESDDYAYVQNKQAMRMFKVASEASTELYNVNTLSEENTFVKIDLGEGFSAADIPAGMDANTYFRSTYLKDIQKMYFNFKIRVITEGDQNEFVSGYADINIGNSVLGPLVDGKYTRASIALVKNQFGNDVTGKRVNDIVKHAWMYAKMNMGRKLVGSADADDGGLQQVVGTLLSSFQNIVKTFSGFPAFMVLCSNGQSFSPDQSYVRLYEPDYIKMGGGYRVKAVVMHDQWKGMTASANDNVNAYYGQYYNYTKLENNKLISSGVALYEPILGGEENPFRYPIYKEESDWYQPHKESFIDGPYGESFFPGAGVGYSKVTVTPIKLTTNSLTNVESNNTGAVVHEFYTAKDFPTRYSQTGIDKERLNVPGLDIFMIYFKVDMLAAVQGYMVELNDMHGKQKSQMVIPASNANKTPQDYANAEGKDAISKVSYYYKQDPNDKTHLANTVTVIAPDMSIGKKDLGVDMDIVHDQRFSDYTSGGFGVEVNLKIMLMGIIPVIVPTLWPDVKFAYSRFKSLATTKVVNRYAIADSTVATDNGSTISTKTLAWDKVTGQPILTSTINEFHDNIYNFNYPAHWAYSRMQMASTNEGMVFTGTPNAGTSGISVNADVFSKLVDGDEVAMMTSETGLDYTSYATNLSGSFIIRKDPVTSTIKLIKPSTGSTRAYSNSFTAKVIRSGNRNMQSTPIGNVTTMSNPIKINGTSSYLAFDNVLNAGATEFKDSWKYFCNCPGDNDATVDPYAKGLTGLMRPWRSHTYLTGRTQNKNNNQLNIRRDGIFTDNFVPFWQTQAQIAALTSACTSTKVYKPVALAGILSPITAGKAYLCSPWQYVTEITNYNPMGMEIENKDALGRYSMAQFGYGRVMPVATSNNSMYQESAFDGFEDYEYQDCRDDHFSWRSIDKFKPAITDKQSHTGLKSYKVGVSSRIKLSKIVSSPCVEDAETGTTGTGTTGTTGNNGSNQQ